MFTLPQLLKPTPLKITPVVYTLRSPGQPCLLTQSIPALSRRHLSPLRRPPMSLLLLLLKLLIPHLRLIQLEFHGATSC